VQAAIITALAAIVPVVVIRKPKIPGGEDEAMASGLILEVIEKPYS
jgi:hypothetical protein